MGTPSNIQLNEVFPSEIVIKEKHFGAPFADSYNCPFAKAAQEAFNDSSLKVGVMFINKNSEPIASIEEGYWDYNYKFDTNNLIGEPEKVVRTFKLTQL